MLPPPASIVEPVICTALLLVVTLLAMAPRMVTFPLLVLSVEPLMRTAELLLTAVPAEPVAGSRPPLIVREPPLVEIVLLVNEIEPLPELLKLENNDTFNDFPVALLIEKLLITMLRCPCKVSDALPTALTLSSTLMSPEVPPTDVV